MTIFISPVQVRIELLLENDANIDMLFFQEVLPKPLMTVLPVQIFLAYGRTVVVYSPNRRLWYVTSRGDMSNPRPRAPTSTADTDPANITTRAKIPTIVIPIIIFSSSNKMEPSITKMSFLACGRAARVLGPLMQGTNSSSTWGFTVARSPISVHLLTVRRPSQGWRTSKFTKDLTLGRDPTPANIVDAPRLSVIAAIGPNIRGLIMIP